MAMQDTLHALADPTRREILNLLKQSRMSAGDIVKNFSVSGSGNLKTSFCFKRSRFNS